VRIHVMTGTLRKQPRVGETKVIRGVLHRREFARDRFGRMLVNSRGGHRYEWIAVQSVEEPPAMQ